MEKLPKHYWELVEMYLPNYSTRQDVADSDDLGCLIDDGDRKEWITVSIEEAEKERTEIDTALFKEACLNYLLKNN